MLCWIFGEVHENKVIEYLPDRASGFLGLERASVNWYLSINAATLPENIRHKGQTTYRSLRMDGREIDFSGGFTDLHTLSYEQILQGNGFGIDDAKPSIQIVHDIRKQQ